MTTKGMTWKQKAALSDVAPHDWPVSSKPQKLTLQPARCHASQEEAVPWGRGILSYVYFLYRGRHC